MDSDQFISLMQEFTQKTQSLDSIQRNKMYEQVSAFTQFIMASQGAGPVAAPRPAGSARFYCPNCQYLIDADLR